ncbi:MAG: outer membrane lipoprotein-sorting protein [Nannocystaceae bacterium]
MTITNKTARFSTAFIAAFFLVFGLSLLHARASDAPSAREVMVKVAATRKLAGSEAVIEMTILNRKGEARTRKIAMATKLFDGGKTEKRIYKFVAPADVKGTGVLTFDYEDKPDDTWIFLPALRKTRRIVRSQRSKSFMGSEFSYADLNVPVISDFSYRHIRSESVDGASCWVIEALPTTKKIAASEGYSRKLYWVHRTEFTIRRAEYYDPKGDLLKELTITNTRLLDPKNKRYRSMHMEMHNRKNGRRSIFHSEKLEFAPATKDEFFTMRYLERP